MSERQRGLGRGLSALLGEAVVETPVTGEVQAAPASPGGAREVPIEFLSRNPDQPRKVFSEQDIEDLSNSIREKGVLQPILVRPDPSGARDAYQIVAGERRWRASQRAGLKTVPILIRELDDLEVLEIGIVENVQRADLNPIEEAQAYKALMDRFGRTQDAVAQVVGKSRSHVANTLRLLVMPDSLIGHVLEGRLTAGHARALANAPNPDLLAEKVVAEGLSVRQAEALAREAAERPNRGKDGGSRGSKNGSGAKSADIRSLETDISEAIGLEVELEDKNGKGELKIKYATLEQLDDLCQRLIGGGF